LLYFSGAKEFFQLLARILRLNTLAKPVMNFEQELNNIGLLAGLKWYVVAGTFWIHRGTFPGISTLFNNQ
jgi:hypothetical protein